MLGRRSALLGAVGVWVGTVLVAALGGFEPLERLAYDVRTGVRFVWESPRRTDDQIVVVAIDDRSLRELGAWPWPPDRYAELVHRLRAAGAATIALDFIPERSSLALERAIEQAGNVVLATGVTPGGTFVRPADPLPERAAALGHIHVEVDPDGVIRRVDLGPRAGAPVALSAAAVAVRTGRPVAGRPILWLSYRRAPTARKGSDFSSLQRTISAADLWSRSRPDLRGAVALVGVTALGLPQDRLVTSLRAFGPVPGVYVQAAAVRSLLWGDRVERGPDVWVWLTSAIGMAIVAWLATRRTALAVTGGAGLLTFGYVLGTEWVFHRYSVWLNVVPPLVSWLVGSGLLVAVAQRQGERRHTQLRRMFSRYVSDSVVREIVRHPDQIRLSGERRRVAVLFADIRGFTRLSERLPAERVVAVLNRYFECMVAAVLANDGLVDKYLGDGLMAIFGAPMRTGNPARQALAAARQMRRQVEEWRQPPPESVPDAGGRDAQGAWPAIGVGLATGEAMVGSVGTAQRLEYTAIGDVVNVAARLQELAGPGEILATEQTVQDAQEPCREQEQITVRGRESPVNVCRL